ncbi:SagB/ThcOx family dehydrogenase [Streptomyces sp. NPDC000941]
MTHTATPAPGAKRPAPPHLSAPPADTGVRLRRARCLVCYWDGDIPVAHPYPHGTPVPLPPAAAGLLAAFDDWATPRQAAACAPGRDHVAVQQDIDHLAAHGVLLAEGSEQAQRDEDLAHHWQPWSPQAAFLHFTTQNFTPAPSGEQPASTPRIALFTTYPDADRILLPRPPADLAAPFGSVIHRRRTHYAFADDPVPLETLAVLLATVFGPVDYVDAGPVGALYRRTSPCAGARQELEAYLAVRNVTSVTPGWYHYNAAEHSLELLAEGCTGEEITTMCAGQEWVSRAAFLLPLIAVVERQLTHHATARSYRVGLLDAGHLGQTFALTATALGLGPFQLAAHHDTALAARLGLNDITHTPLHLLGAGQPTARPNPTAVPAGLDAFRRTSQ